MRCSQEELDKQAAFLARRISRYLGHPMTPGMLEAVWDLVIQHRRQCRLDGLDFPELVPLCIPELGTIDLYRRELDAKGIEAAILKTAAGTPGATPTQIATAVKRCWPWYHVDIDNPRLRGTVLNS